VIKAAVDRVFKRALAAQNRVPARVVPAAATWILLLVAVNLVLFFPPRASADLNSAVKNYNSGQHEAAIAELLTLAEAGHSDAKYALGVIYVEGKGIPVDTQKALKWLREAANEGNPNAQFSLGVMNARGTGVPPNIVRGLMWMNISGRNTNHSPWVRMKTISIGASMKKSMTPEQIKQAEELTAAWKPQH